MRWLTDVLKKLSSRPKRNPVTDEATAQQAILNGNIKRFQQFIGYTIRNPEYFLQALLHRSFLPRAQKPQQSNERLEFLGDSILNLIVGEYLYHQFPSAEEGELTKSRSRLVNRKALAAYAKAIHLPEFIIMSPSAAQSAGKGFDTIAADTYEAVVAAIYLDGGFEAARTFVERQMRTAVKKGSVLTADENYKSMLLEYAQAKGLGVPRYTIVKEEGPDHDRTFTVDVTLGNLKRGSGSGKNKKEAEQAAASQALESFQ